MKKYQTWEAIKMLGENPGLKFRIKVSSGICIMTIGDYQYLTIKWDNQFTGLERNVKPNSEWELIQERVTFIEAVKAFDKGKIIKCKYDDNEFIYAEAISGLLESKSGVLEELQGVGAREILYGDWFIEE